MSEFAFSERAGASAAIKMLHTTVHWTLTCGIIFAMCVISQGAREPTFVHVKHYYDPELRSRPPRTSNKTEHSEAGQTAKKPHDNSTVGHLLSKSRHNVTKTTTTLSPLEEPVDEDDDTPAPAVTTPAPPRTTPVPPPRRPPASEVVTSFFQRARTIVLTPGLVRGLTQLTPASQQVFKTRCLVARKCTEAFVTGPELSWILPAVSERVRTRLWNQLQCTLQRGRACPVDGGWGAWGAWSDCSATCGAVGERVRRRLCDRPAPAGGGLRCRGRSAEIQYCVSRGCGLDRLAGFMTERNPSQQLALQIVQREVRAHPELEARCVREHCSYEHARDLVGNASVQALWLSLHCLKESVACPLVGGWSEWSAFSECSAAPCGDGQRLRFRACSDPPPSLPESDCRGRPYQARDCSLPCRRADETAAWAPFGPWSECSARCGVGTQQRHRACRIARLRQQALPPARIEIEEVDETETMAFRRRRSPYDGPRRIDLRFDDSDDARPKATTVAATTPAESGGADPALCGGSSREVRICRPECAVDGGWSEWSGWSACSAACGPGVSTRDRLCTEPPPSAAGRPCDGPGSEVHYCFQRPCAVETRLLASFNGSGHLVYRPLYMPAALLLLYARFRPETPDCVLLHRFQTKCPEAHNCDWTRLRMVSGFLVVESTMRGCKVKLEGKPALELGRWHEAAVAIVGDRAFLRLDNAEENRKAYLTCAPDGPNYDMDMYVGADRNRHEGFRGTVSALAVNYMEYSLKMEPDWTAGGVPAISEGVATGVATADDVYVSLDADDFFTAQCPENGTAERLDFVATVQIRQHGVLMFTRGRTQASFVYVKTGDVFRLCLQLEAARECLASTQPSQLGTWYRLRVLVEPKVVTMVVNFVHRTRLQRGLPFRACRKIVYVGGGPPETLKKIGEPNGFQGLVESFLVNGRRDSSREMSVKEWGGTVGSAVAAVADHYTEAVYQEGHAPVLSCDYSDVVENGSAAGANASAHARARWLRLDQLIDSESGAVERSPPYSVLRLDARSRDVQGFYGCLVSTPARTWVLHAFGVSFVRAALIVPESLAEEWVAGTAAAVGLLLLLMAAGLLYASRGRRFGLFPGLMRMVYGERLSESEQLEYLQLQTGEFVRLTPSRRGLLRPSKQALIVSRSKRALATPSRTVTISPSRQAEFFLEPSKTVRFAGDLQVDRTPSGRAVNRTPSGAAVAATASGRVLTSRTLLGRGASVSPSGRITDYTVDLTETEESESDDSDTSATPLLTTGDDVTDGQDEVIDLQDGMQDGMTASDSGSEGFPPPPGTADSLDSESLGSQPLSP